MTKYEKAMKLIEERCGQEKEEIIALATIDLTPTNAGASRPVVRLVSAYYEDGAFYVSTDARKNKMKQIEKNNEVSVCGFGWYSFHGIAENLGWVKDEKNAYIREKFKKCFEWFEQDGGEDDPNSIILKINLTEGSIIDFEQKYGELHYKIDFINKVAD